MEAGSLVEYYFCVLRYYERTEKGERRSPLLMLRSFLCVPSFLPSYLRSTPPVRHEPTILQEGFIGSLAFGNCMVPERGVNLESGSVFTKLDSGRAMAISDGAPS